MPAFYRALEVSKQIALYAANNSAEAHKKLSNLAVGTQSSLLTSKVDARNLLKKQTALPINLHEDCLPT
jgi:hypothetical protein